MQSINTCLRKSVAFSGRASRSEFWWFALVFIIFNIVIFFASSVYLVGIKSTPVANLWSNVLFFILAATTVPLFTSGMRRLDDVGKPSGFLVILTALYWLMIFGLVVPALFGSEPLRSAEAFVVLAPLWFSGVVMLFVINLFLLMAPSVAHTFVKGM